MTGDFPCCENGEHDRELLATFTVWGEPLPKERPRFGNRRTYTPKKTVGAEQRVLDAFHDALPLWDATTDHVRLEADFHRKGRRAVDLDNMFKLLTDALNKVLYLDDSQICEQETRRFYGAGEKARTEVRVYLVAGDVA